MFLAQTRSDFITAKLTEVPEMSPSGKKVATLPLLKRQYISNVFRILIEWIQVVGVKERKEFL